MNILFSSLILIGCILYSIYYYSIDIILVWINNININNAYILPILFI